MGIIRLILAISVIISHSESFFGLQFVGGQYAVQIFFMISGFYMALVLNRKYVGEGSYKLFLTNRALKIYPVYFVSLFFVFVLVVLNFFVFKSVAIVDPYFTNFNEMSFFSFLFLAIINLIILGQDMVMFLGLDTVSGSLFFTSDFRETDPKVFTFLLNRPAWSISVELMFYIIAPFLITKKMHVLFSVLIFSLSIKLIVLYYVNLNYDPWTYRFFFSELMFFMLGAISYRLYSFFSEKKLFFGCSRFCFFVFSLLLFYIVFFDKVIGFFDFSCFDFFGFCFNRKDVFVFVLYFLSFVSIPFIFDLTKKWQFDRFVGELSYPVYIFHYIVLIVVSKVLGYLDLYFLSAEIATFLTIVLSILVMLFLIRPIDSYREKRIENAREKYR